MRSIILLFFTVFTWTVAFASDGEDSLMNDYISEGQRQYQELVRFNQQNRKEGRQQDNLYIFSLDKNEDFLTQWVAYRSMSAAEKDEYSSDFLTNLNTYLGEVNADENVKFEIYVCLVSNFKVRLKVPLDDDLNQQGKVLASLKAAYEKSKSNDDKAAYQNYDAYRTTSRKALNGLIDQAFKNRKPNHIIISEISYYQFSLKGNDKLVSNLRGSTFVRVTGMEKARQDRLLADMATKGTDFNYSLGAVSYSERDVEQEVKKVEHFLLTPDDPNKKQPETIDITALDESTKEERDAHWMRDVDALADSINQNSILADVNNYVINLSTGRLVGLNEEISVFHHKFKVLDYETGTKFIVAFTPVDYTIPEFKKNQFAKDVLSKVDLKGNKVVLVTIPVYSFADKSNKAQAVTSMGVAAAPIDLVDAKFQNSVDPREFIINAYKRVPKPYTAHVYMVNVREQIAYSKKVSNGPVRGFASIYDVLIYKSKYLDQVENLPIPKCWGPGCSGTVLGQELEKYAKERFRLITEGIAQEAINPQGTFRELDSDKWNTKRLKEDVVDQKHLAYFNFAIKGELGQWFSSLGTLMGFTELTTLDFYTFDQWNVIDPIVYGAIDIAGFIPVIENFSDAVGLIYASVRGNIDQVENYAIGLTIVGAGAVTVKAFKYVVALRKADNTVELVARNASEITEMEARDIVTYVPDNLKEQEVKGIIDQISGRVTRTVNGLPAITWPSELIRKKFVDAGLLDNIKTLEFQKLLSRANLSPEAADGMILMIKSISDADVQKIAVKIDGLGEGGIKFLEDVKAGLGDKMDWTKWDDKLVDAWKVLNDAKVKDVLRRDPRILAGVRDYCN